MLIIPCEERIPQMQLCNNAAERPDINFPVISNSQDDLRCPVVPALDVSVNCFVLEAARAKVNDFDTGFVCLLQENILRF